MDLLAAVVGFEPTDGSSPPTVFKTAALNHSAIPPHPEQFQSCSGLWRGKLNGSNSHQQIIQFIDCFFMFNLCIVVIPLHALGVFLRRNNSLFSFHIPQGSSLEPLCGNFIVALQSRQTLTSIQRESVMRITLGNALNSLSSKGRNRNYLITAVVILILIKRKPY